MYKCQVCSYSSYWSHNLRRHEKTVHTHSKEIFHLGENQPTDTISSMNHDVYDVRLKENFKIFISGPSRCGKTVFVSNLLERINEFTKMPPTNVIYVYKVWQSKYDEMLSLGVNFKEDNDNIVNDIKSSVSGEPIEHKLNVYSSLQPTNTVSSTNPNDIRLKENFKVFISGPSRCGKTVFVSNLLERINEFAKVPPTNVIYVYKVWQSKYDEMMS